MKMWKVLYFDTFMGAKCYDRAGVCSEIFLNSFTVKHKRAYPFWCIKTIAQLFKPLRDFNAIQKTLNLLMNKMTRNLMDIVNKIKRCKI